MAGPTVVRAQARRRWCAVFTVVAVLCSVPVVVGAWPVHAAAVAPAVLRQRIAASAAVPHAGSAQTAGVLGLPDLPDLGQVTALLSGTTRLRVWYAAADRWRVDTLLDGGGERGVYQVPGAQFLWDFGDAQVTQVLGTPPVRLPRAADLTPPELARRVLAAAAGDPVTALPDRRVAGRAAAGLRLVPASPRTTVAHVDVWADPATGLPLQAEVTARGGTRPVFVTRFLDVALAAPDPAVLLPPRQRPGVGYTVTGAPDVLGALGGRFGAALPDRLGGAPRRDPAGLSAAGAYGDGLGRLVAVVLPGRFGYGAYARVAAFGRSVDVPGAQAAVLGTGLLSVLVVRARRTYLVAGLVPPQVLEPVAGELAGAAA